VGYIGMLVTVTFILDCLNYRQNYPKNLAKIFYSVLPFGELFSELTRTMDATIAAYCNCKVLSTEANIALDAGQVADYLEKATTIYCMEST